jgi:AcrR family transcriptional regulator
VSAKLPPGLLARVAGDERSAWERTAATLVGAGHDVSARDPDYGLAQVLFAQFWVRGVHEDVRAVADASQLEGSTRQMAGAGRVVVPDRRRASLLRARERAGARLAGPIAAHRDSELDAPAVRPVHLCTVTALEPGGHRERLITAMAVSIADKGYRDTTVADVVRVARTSRRNFYEHFVDRDACFLALFDVTNAALMAEIAAAVDPLLTLDEQVDIAVDTYIASVLDRPELYHSFVRELPGLREAGAERAQAALEGFAQLLIGLVDSGRRARPELALRPLDMDTAIIIVGGLRELLVIALQRGRDMRELRASAGHAIKLILIGKLL